MIINLPTDVINYKIFNYLTLDSLKLTCKKYWLQYYNKKSEVLISLNNSYYRYLIRKNLFFVFDIYFNKLIEKHNIINVKKKKKYKYKNMIFSNKIDEIIYYSRNNNNNCQEIIQKNKKKLKKKFKKTKQKNNKWTN